MMGRNESYRMLQYTRCKMVRETYAKSWISTVILILITVFLFRANLNNLSLKGAEYNQVTEKSPDSSEELNKAITKRNEISRLLNEKMMQLGKLQCEKSMGTTNEQGGWCKNQSTERGGLHRFDGRLVPVLSAFLRGKSVASFGDGPGAYKREILKLGEVNRYDAYDGAPFCQETSEGRVTFLDLSIPQYGLPVYDWVISLEVAEHIHPQYESTFLDNIFRHAKEGIILSWAIPGQNGLQHVNNRPLQYVIDVMESNGFGIDRGDSKILQDGAEKKHLKRNIYVYVRSLKLNGNFSIYG